MQGKVSIGESKQQSWIYYTNIKLLKYYFLHIFIHIFRKMNVKIKIVTFFTAAVRSVYLTLIITSACEMELKNCILIFFIGLFSKTEMHLVSTSKFLRIFKFLAI